MSKIFDHEIEFPNGLGYTPCTKEYFDIYQAKDMLSDGGRIMPNDMSSEDYNRFCHLDNDALNLQADGHLGKSVRY